MSIDHSLTPVDRGVLPRPFVSVIVPHYQQVDLLQLCLESLEAQKLSRECFEIIVIDNKSVCDLSVLRAKFADVKFLIEAKKGAAHARNRGLEAARGDVIAFTDADCIADPEWLSNGIAALEHTDLLGGAINVTVANEEAMTAVEAFECVFAFHQQKYIERKHFAVTANLFVHRKVANAIGPFHNGLAEDADWCWRARTLGFRLAFNDTSIINHPARTSWEDLTKKWDRLVRERWHGFGGQRFERRFLWIVLACATALSWVPHLMPIVWSRRVGDMRAKVSAASVLIRIRLWRAFRMLTVMRSQKSLSTKKYVEA